MKIYKVGGAVRDCLLNKIPKDSDYLVVGSSVREMESLGYKQVGRAFPVFLHPETKEEYALARKEEKTGDGHRDFRFFFDDTITLEEDLERRDFTCNALALDLENGEITDLFNGKRDIENKILRHINAVHFKEDPLRILRFCRFAAQLGFEPAAETLVLVSEMVGAGMLDFLSADRQWAELEKALKTERFDAFVDCAKKCGVLECWGMKRENALTLLEVLKRAHNEKSHVKFGVFSFYFSDLPAFYGSVNVPKNYRAFANALRQNAEKFKNLMTLKMTDAVKTIQELTKKTDMNDVLSAYACLFENICEQKALALRMHEVLKGMNARRMPHFETLCKEKDFGERFFLFCVETVENDEQIRFLKGEKK